MFSERVGVKKPTQSYTKLRDAPLAETTPKQRLVPVDVHHFCRMASTMGENSEHNVPITTEEDKMSSKSPLDFKSST